MNTPLSTWKSNKWRIDLRSYTRKFVKKFESTDKIHMIPGSIYAVKYSTDNSVPTDKHHVTPVFISFGRFSDDNGKTHVRGINLFYLKTPQKLEILEEVSKFYELKPSNRVVPIIKIHEKWMKIAPYAFKNFEERRIVGLEEVLLEDWGMIPLLKMHLIGNFNAEALNEDFKSESKTYKRIKHTSNKKIEDVEDADEEDDYVSDSLITSSETVDLDSDEYDI